ncbi:hypothetical protein [Brevibacillus choshinensis]|uniref:hypothetical protein n=1 Tax=Brevibacillus choshinensis TaxID=54911 RepID=UPI002E201793|nr:hypothetical protein [Brevibacillus choshinensis]
MTNILKESAQRVQNTLRDLGYGNQVVELPDSTRTAQEAADAIGCEVDPFSSNEIGSSTTRCRQRSEPCE